MCFGWFSGFVINRARRALDERGGGKVIIFPLDVPRWLIKKRVQLFTNLISGWGVSIVMSTDPTAMKSWKTFCNASVGFAQIEISKLILQSTNSHPLKRDFPASVALITKQKLSCLCRCNYQSFPAAFRDITYVRLHQFCKSSDRFHRDSSFARLIMTAKTFSAITTSQFPQRSYYSHKLQSQHQHNRYRWLRSFHKQIFILYVRKTTALCGIWSYVGNISGQYYAKLCKINSVVIVFVINWRTWNFAII